MFLSLRYLQNGCQSCFCFRYRVCLGRPYLEADIAPICEYFRRTLDLLLTVSIKKDLMQWGVICLPLNTILLGRLLIGFNILILQPDDVLSKFSPSDRRK